MAEEKESLEVGAQPSAVQHEAEHAKEAPQDKKSLAIGGQRPSMRVENWKMAQYMGDTLTVEQQKAKDAYEKNIAEMENKNGDRKRSKRQPSSDKFKEEDVVKYMYEEWFLAGLSWICNKIENKTLDLIDAAANQWQDRHNSRAAEKKAYRDARLAEAHQKVNALDDHLKKDITEHLDSFCSGENLTEAEKKDLNAMGALVFRLNAAHMKDDFMRNDSSWREDHKKGEKYKGDDDIHADLLRRAYQQGKHINEALLNMEPDQRNAFLKEFNERLQKVEFLQEDEIKKDKFDVIGQTPDENVKKELKSLDAFIEEKCGNQKEQTLEEAAHAHHQDNPLDQKLNDINTQQSALNRRREDVNSRRKALDAAKERMSGNAKNPQGKTFSVEKGGRE